MKILQTLVVVVLAINIVFVDEKKANSCFWLLLNVFSIILNILLPEDWSKYYYELLYSTMIPLYENIRFRVTSPNLQIYSTFIVPKNCYIVPKNCYIVPKF